MAVIELNSKNIFETIEKSLCLFINFSFSEKKQSIEFSDMFEKFSEKHKSVVFGSVRTEVENDIVEGFQITKTPTLMVFLEGQEARNVPGGCDEATMKAFINEIIYELEQAAKKT